MTGVLRPAALRDEWAWLRTGEPSPPLYEPGLTAGLPAAAQRWLAHSLRPGTPLWSSVELTMSGQIKLGPSWRPFQARQILAPQKGFIWAAEARVGGLPVRGYDRFSKGAGQMRWRLLGVLPVVTAGGADVSRSAAGRLASEGVLVPTAFRSAAWSAGLSPDTAVMTRVIDGEAEDVTLRVDPSGALTEVSMLRWGTPGGAPPGRHPFGVSIEAETEFGGVTLPSILRAGWWKGTSGRSDDGEFFRARISKAVFR
ncbi:DUF6544 family protein [Arthrobacter zhaoguopingii]|uniref:DUF6544 family protein n=1 Tax=Arthrobacter zhaoguopingii TaxID=2681491 RepID=UPI001915150C|nr:DUF6544 family protein [Arthrobacter zhaoguopingii]